MATDIQNKPAFETIYGIKVIPPGCTGVLLRLGKVIGVEEPGYVLGIPFLHEIALVPETPGEIKDLESKVRSCDNRAITVLCETNVIIDDPEKFMKKAPDNYLERIEPGIINLMQQLVGARYKASEMVSNNHELSTLVQKALDVRLEPWGLQTQSFWYTASIDPADLVSGDAEKLRKAELADATARKDVMAMEAHATGNVKYIVAKYEIDIDVYRIENEGKAIANLQKQVGLAQVDVLNARLNAYGNYIGQIVDKIIDARKKLETKDGEILIAYLLAPLTGMLGTASQGNIDEITTAVTKRITSRLRGEGAGAYVREAGAEGVNPNIALMADILPDAIRGFKGQSGK